jgi:alpha-glucosidase (family GH31 glycosyl hydrolase)
MRGSAKDIIAEYHNFIGKPKLVPFWAMGFHASGNGWHSLDKVRDVVANYSNTSTPLESVWLNGDYMDGFKDFSLNDNFKDLKVYTKQLHDNGQKVVVTLLGGLANENNTNPYVADSNVSLIMGMDGKPFSAEVYTNETVFLDWFQ